MNAVRIPVQYPEVQEDEMELLLKFSAKHVINSLPHQNVFSIMEQTAVYFRSYGPKSKRPGFFFKQWWESKTQKEFKHVVASDPRATIESGVALLIPHHEPIIFLNQQRGHISFEGSVRPENKKYPWLSSDDFNLFFVPKGANQVYDAMPLNLFLKYDFRRPNIDEVCSRLSEYEAIIRSDISIENIRHAASRYPSIVEQARLEP